MKKILFSWIGHADLQGMANTSGDEAIVEAVRKIAPAAKPVSVAGPVKIALAQRRFDSVILLSDYDDAPLLESYRKYLGADVRIRQTKLSNPMDYGAIYETVKPVLQQATEPDAENFYLLSPGTPAMAAIWILLGKTQFPGRFLQVYQGEVKESVIPFDLTLEVIPDLMRKTERVLQSMPFDADAIPPGFENIVGTSPVMRQIVARADKAAHYDVPILLTGESGTGKEMFARAIWKASCRANKPFEAINCAALPASLLESELFGYRKGAFTGANRDKEGAFKRLDGGTLFLDEIGECTPDLQAKLLRVLQPPPGEAMTCREFSPIGSDNPERSDVRILAATNRNLRKMITQEDFRSDLFFRIAAITIELPPLRERPEDILPIAETLLKRANADLKRANPSHKDKIFCENTKIFIQKQSWLGNVRELFNAVLQGIVMSDSEKIKIEDLGYAECKQSTPILLDKSLDDALKELEVQYITAAMERTHGNKTQAAKLLGMSSYQRLDARLKALNLKIFSE